MARVAVAYVEVRPDLSGFAGKLETALKKIRLTEKVKITPDTADFAQAVAKSPAVKAAGKVVGDTVGEEAGKKIPASMVQHFKASSGQIRNKMAAVLSVDAEYAAGRAAARFRRNFGAKQLIDPDMEHSLVSSLAQLYGAAGKAAGRAMVREHNNAVKVIETRERQAAARRIKEATRTGAATGRHWSESFAKTMKVGLNLRLGQLAPILTVVAVAAAPLAQALSALGAGFVSLAAAAGVMAAGLATAGVSALVAFGQAAGVAVFATKGLGDAMKALDNIQTKLAAGIELTAGDVNNLNEAMAKLSPNARAVVVSLGRVHGQLANIRKSVQQRLFVGFADDIARLAKDYLPVMSKEMGATADVVNRAGREFAAFAGQASTVGKVSDVMAGNTRIARAMTGALVPLADATLTLLRAVQPLGEALAQYVTAWAQATNSSVQAADASGRLAGIVYRLQAAMDQAIRITRNIGTALKSTFTAVLGPGQTLLAMFETLTARWAAWASSFAGQNAMNQWAATAIPTFQALGRLIGDIGRMFSTLAKSGDAPAFIDQLRQIIPPLTALLTQLSSSNAAGAFAAGLAKIAEALAELGVGGILADAVMMVGSLISAIVWLTQTVPGATTALQGLLLALAALQAVKLTATLTGLAQIPKLSKDIAKAAKAVRAFTVALFGMEAVGKAGRLGYMVSNLGSAAAYLTRQLIATRGAILLTAASMVIVKAATIAWTAVQWLLNIALTANPIGVIIMLIAALVAAIIWVLYKTGALAKAWDALGKTIKFVLPTLKDLEKQLIELGKRLVNFLKLAPGVQKLVDMFEKLKDYGVAAFTALMRMMGLTQKKQDETGRNAKDMANTHDGALKSMEGDLDAYRRNANWDAIRNQMKLAGDYGVAWSRTFKGTTEAMVNNMAGLAAAAYATGNAIDQATYEKHVGKAYKRAKDAGQSIGQAFREGASQTMGSAYSYSGSVSGALESSVKTTTAKAASAGKRIATGYVSNFRATLKSLDPFVMVKGWYTGAYNSGREIANYLAKGITSGSKNIRRVSTYIQRYFSKQKRGYDLADILGKDKAFADKAKSISKAVPDLARNIRKYTTGAQLDSYLAKQQAYWTGQLELIKDFKSSAVAALTQGADMVGLFGFIPTPAEVKAQLDAHLAQMNDFTNTLAALQKAGLSKELARKWLEAGVDQAGNLVQGLKGATRAELEAISRQYANIGTGADAAADRAATAFYGTGQATVQGYIDGIKSMRTMATTEMANLIKGLIASVKKKLKIKSPSQVFAGLGTNTIAGYVKGVESMERNTLRSVGSLYDAVKGVSPPTLAPRFATRFADTGQLGMAPPNVDVKVFMGDRELTDIVRTEVSYADSTRARALLAGRRGG